MSVSAAENTVEAKAAVDPAAVAPTARPSDHGWVWQVTALSGVLGVMLALAINTTTRIRNSGIPLNRFGVSAAILSTYKEQNENLQGEIQDLRRQINDLEQSANSTSQSTVLLKDQLQEIRTLSGLAPVQGPGLKILLRDSPEPRLKDLPPEEEESYLVHDVDINGLLNELKAAGSEALAISGADADNIQRVVVTTTARCVGPNAIINGTQISAPYTIYAIGNPKELRSALEMPKGYIQIRYLDVLKMIQIEEAANLVLPEYNGRFSPKYARPAPPKS
jgi:uncharacterized protein YlxW (UPF0749 family)